MARLKVTFTAAAVHPDCRPSLPRSGACTAPLPAWHPHEVIMLGGYTEDRSERGGTGARVRGGDPAASSTAAPQPPSPPPRPQRAPTIEAWTFSFADGGHWHPVTFAAGSPVPQPRLTCQAAVVGDELYLVGGWNPSAPPDAPQFLNDVWVLDLRSLHWRRVQLAGAEELPPISRFAMVALPDFRLVLHTHRCDDHVLMLSTSCVGRGERGELTPSDTHTLSSGAVLIKAAVRGASPGERSPPSRGLHSLTAAAPALQLQPQQQQQPDAAGSAANGSSSSGTMLYMYGGAPQSGPMYGDLWVLDTGSMTWRRLAPSGPTPQPRCSHVAGVCSGGDVIAGRYLLFIGGSYYVQQGQLQPLDDVILYDTQTNRWVEAEVEGPRPSPRNAAIMAPLGSGNGGGDRFVLHGGWRPFVETYDDTYIVTVTAGQ